MDQEPEPFALTADEAVALLERALAEPLPDEGHRDFWEADGRMFSGDGHRGLRLAMSRFFWDAPDRIDAEYELMEPREAAVLERFGALHGEPTDLRVWEWDDRGPVMAHPLSSEFGVDTVRLWRLEDTARFVTLGVSHMDKEMPLELLAVIGDLAWLDAARPWRREEQPPPSLASPADIARLNAKRQPHYPTA